MPEFSNSFTYIHIDKELSNFNFAKFFEQIVNPAIQFYLEFYSN